MVTMESLVVSGVVCSIFSFILGFMVCYGREDITPDQRSIEDQLNDDDDYYI